MDIAALVGMQDLYQLLALGVAHIRSRLRRARCGPTDVTVTSLFVSVAPPGRGESFVLALVANPGAGTVLAGLSVSRRRGPAWFGTRPKVKTVRRSTRRRYRADRQSTIAIAPARQMRALPVPFVAMRGRYRMVAVVGQADQCLRVISLPLAVGESRASA